MQIIRGRAFIFMNAVFIAYFVWALYPDKMYECGRCALKPVLSDGLSPTWFDDRFQINRGQKAVISSGHRGVPYDEAWVSGDEDLLEITHYSTDPVMAGVLFKATNTKGERKSYLLRETDSLEQSKFVYRVTEIGEKKLKTLDPRWIGVSTLNCTKGVYALILIGATLVLFGINFFGFICTRKGE